MGNIGYLSKTNRNGHHYRSEILLVWRATTRLAVGLADSTISALIEVDLDVLEDMAREDLVTDYEVLGIHCRTIAHFERPVPYSFSSRPAIWRESSWRSRCRELVWVFFDGD